MNKKTNKNKKLETSKKLAYTTIYLFVICVLFILIYILMFKCPTDNAAQAIEVLKIVSTPVSIILTGYFGKALVENYKKITSELNNSDEN